MQHLDPNARGALFMVICMLGFTLNDTLMKIVLGELPLFQAVFLRGIASTLLLGAIAWRLGAFKGQRLGFDPLILFRIVGEVGATLCFFTAISHIPLADATAIAQVTPLAVTLGAALFLGEPVGWRRLLAILVGFAGVMLIVRPGTSGFSAYSALVLGSVAFVALRDLATRRLRADMPSTLAALITSAATTVMGGVGALTQPWAAVSGTHIALLGGAAVLLCVGYVFSTMTMRVGDVSFSAPFRYVSLVWAIIAGILVFSDFPDMWMLIGSAIVVGTGIYTFYREKRLNRKALAREAAISATAEV